ncbi:GGDEF domain-containing protein [Actinoplanes sp. NBC_00393]|uniref:GGDEF domain-containing protein n=1 Tax=Actinoplanes sp. NBC_00393 TaxID=2975953 RepID=UPI002E1A29E1
MFTTDLVITTIVAIALGAGLGHLATRRSVTRLRAALADAAWQLTHDSLTGLYNRTGLQAACTAAEPQPIVVILIDVDRFKEVNDTYGHGAGDILLVRIASRIGELADVHHGSAARLSGDEFVAVVPLGGQRLDRLADMLTTVLAVPTVIPTDEGPVSVAVTASLGIAVVAGPDLVAVGLRNADTAMYHAKRRGGDQHVLHAPGMTMPVRTPRKGPRTRDLHRRAEGGGE